MVFDALDQAGGVEVGDDALAGVESVQPAVACRRVVVEAGVGIEDVHHRKIVTLADGVVVEVVRWRYLHAARAELAVYVVVGDYRDAAGRQGQIHGGTYQRAVAFVFGMDGDGRVAQHGLRAGGGDYQIVFAVERARALGQRVADMPKVAGLLDVLHFQIGNRRLQRRIPVDQPLAAVDQAIVVETHEDLQHRARESFVHGEALAVPVHGRAPCAGSAA